MIPAALAPNIGDPRAKRQGGVDPLLRVDGLRVTGVGVVGRPVGGLVARPVDRLINLRVGRLVGGLVNRSYHRLMVVRGVTLVDDAAFLHDARGGRQGKKREAEQGAGV